MRRSVMMYPCLFVVLAQLSAGCCWRPFAWRWSGFCLPACGPRCGAGPIVDGPVMASPIVGAPGCASCFASPAMPAPVSAPVPTFPVSTGPALAYPAPIASTPLHSPTPMATATPAPMPSQR